MKVIVPNATNALSSTVPEPDSGEKLPWAAVTSYAKDAECIYNHVMYRSIAGGNTGNNPEKTLSGADAKWRKIGSTNRWRMFDEMVHTQTTTSDGVESLVVEMDFNRATAFAALNMSALRFNVNVYAGKEAEPYYTREYDLLKDRRSRWRYRYEPAAYVKDVVDTDIGIVPKGRIRFEWETLGGTVGVGHVVVGRAYNVGLTLFGAAPSIRSYSKVIEDDFGNATFVRRQSAKKIRCDLYLEPSRLDDVFAILRGLINVPALWIGDNRSTREGGFESLTTWGYLQNVEAPIEGPNLVSIPIEIMGLI